MAEPTNLAANLKESLKPGPGKVSVIKPAAAPQAPKSDTPAQAKRGRKPGVPAKERAVIPAEHFKMVAVPAAERVTHKRRREDRTPQQIEVDNAVAEVYDNWVEAGRPANWADMPITLWPVPKTYADDAEFLLRKAAALHGRKLVFGQRVEEDVDGIIMVTLPYCVIARPERKPKPSND